MKAESEIGLSSLLFHSKPPRDYPRNVAPKFTFDSAFNGSLHVKGHCLSVIRNEKRPTTGSFTKLTMEAGRVIATGQADAFSKVKFGIPKDYLDFGDQFIDRSAIINNIRPGQSLPSLRFFLLYKHLDVIKQAARPEHSSILTRWQNLLSADEVPPAFVDAIEPTLEGDDSGKRLRFLLGWAEELNPAFTDAANEMRKRGAWVRSPHVTWVPFGGGVVDITHDGYRYQKQCRESLLKTIRMFSSGIYRFAWS